ncbi:MAG: hypothetical protein KatS3mg007_0330 [Thermoanaerobaculum sp.]|nr:MAG: hypothetical protein KatS3mg007_0330 [Thermoanaerobaculum sp.]GBC80551.1 hypothetical protein HRbin09_01794 [bacterium HR09]
MAPQAVSSFDLPAGVRVSASPDGKFLVVEPAELLTPEHEAKLVELKPRILALLRWNHCPTCLQPLELQPGQARAWCGHCQWAWFEILGEPSGWKDTPMALASRRASMGLCPTCGVWLGARGCWRCGATCPIPGCDHARH